MAFSGGTFSRTFDCTTDRDNGVKILADKFDTELDGMAVGLSTAILKDGTQTCTAAIPFAQGITLPDNKTIAFGTNSDVLIQYDETTTDSLKISAAEGAGLAITLMADEGDDAGDEWKLNIADGGTLTLGNDINSAGTYVTHLTITPNATVASSTVAVAGNLTIGGALTLGSGAVISEAELEAINGVTAGTVAASKAVIVDSNKDAASFRNLTATGAVTGGSFVIGSADISEAELETIDGVTAGTVSASKAMIVDADKDITGGRNLTITGELDAATLDISGNADIDGTLEADAMTLNGTAITTVATLSTGISNGNLPVFTSGAADDDFLRINGTEIEGRSATEVLSDIGAQASLTFGLSNTNAVKIDSTSVADDEYARFTASGLESRSTSEVLSDIGAQASLTFGISNTNAVKVDSTSVANDEYARFTANGLESRSTSEVLSDIGAAPAAGSSNIVTSGALNAGSITSGFGSIDTGSSAISTTGAVTGGSFVIGSANISEAELETIDGVTAGTVAASKVAVVDGSKDITGFRNVTLTGELDAASLDISGNADIDGTLEADAITINGTALATVIAGTTVTDATNSAHVLVTDNESTNEENLIAFVEGATSTTGNVGLEMDGTLTYNPSSGTVSATVFKGNIDAVDGDFDGTLETDALSIGGTTITTTAAEINLIDGGTARGTTAVADGDGVLINDAGTMRMTKVDTLSTYMAGKSVGGANIVTTGALNAGSITSGFGAIDVGSSAITTTGAVNFGSLADGAITITAFVDEDNMSSNSATLVPTQQSVKAYVDANAGGGGAWNVISTTTVTSDVTSIDFTSIGSYKRYVLKWDCTMNNAALIAIKIYDNGSLVTSSDYVGVRGTTGASYGAFQTTSTRWLSSTGMTTQIGYLEISAVEPRLPFRMEVAGLSGTGNSGEITYSTGGLKSSYSLTSLSGLQLATTGTNDIATGRFSLYGLSQ